MKTVSAKLSHARISARKARLSAGLIRGKSYLEAERQLLFSPKKASELLLEVLRSAKANAIHNDGLDEMTLKVHEVRVGDAGMLKRYQPRAYGRAYMVRKRRCHIEVILSGESAQTKKASSDKANASTKKSSGKTQNASAKAADSTSTSAKQSKKTSVDQVKKSSGTKETQNSSSKKTKKAEKSALTSSDNASSSS